MVIARTPYPIDTCVSMENRNADTKLCTLSTHVSGCFTRMSRYQAVANINHEMEKLCGGEIEMLTYRPYSLKFWSPVNYDMGVDESIGPITNRSIIWGWTIWGLGQNNRGRNILKIPLKTRKNGKSEPKFIGASCMYFCFERNTSFRLSLNRDCQK